jgi:hypothetical protein
MQPSAVTISLGQKGRLTNDHVVLSRISEDRRNPEPLGLENDNFSLEELDTSLKADEAMGAEGPDGLAPRFLKNLGGGGRSKSFMQGTFNRPWREGVCPQAWRDVVIVPIKPGKPEGQLYF